MYLNTLMTPASIGKRRRLNRILGTSSKAIVAALDDSLISTNNVGLKNLQEKINNIESAKPNGILCYYGTASSVSALDVPLIVNVTASTVQSCHTNKVLVSSVQQAIAIDAAAVAVHVNISSKYESNMLHNLGMISEICNTYGMPLFAIIYPRKEHILGDENYISIKENNIPEYTKLVSHCVRVAFELGADIIKTQYTGNAESFSEVVLSANGRPVLIAGGSLCEEEQLYGMVEGAMKAGGAGVSIGRNIFNRPNSAEIINNLRKIVFQPTD